MTWIKEDTWVPDGVDEKEIFRSDENLPHVIFSHHRNWWHIRNEVDVEDLGYPIVLKSLFSTLYGLRIRGYEFRHVNFEEMGTIEWEKFQRWVDHGVRCRVAA